MQDTTHRVSPTSDAVIDTILRAFDQSRDIATNIEHVRQGTVFFAIRAHKSSHWLNKLLWGVWGWLELYGNPFLRALDTLIACGPTTIKQRWQSLRAYQFNGNAQAQLAIERGAACVVIDQGPVRDERYVRVNDVRAALYTTARRHRLRFDIPVVGITGSCGKTTTKEWLASILTRSLNVIATDGNFNTLEGVAHTLFRINDQTDVVILELSASIMETVREKTHMSCPTIGVITKIGKAHLSGFGDLDGVKTAKRQLYDYLIAQQQTVVVNNDDAVLMALVGDYAKTLTYGTSVDAAVKGNALANRWTLDLQWQSRDVTPQTVHTSLFGHYNCANALAAITIALELKSSVADINAGIAQYEPTNMRSQIMHIGDTTVVLDTYNANPTSMRAALQDFCQYAPAPRAVILGDMAELGAHTHGEHEALMSYLLSQHIDKIFLVGAANQRSAQAPAHAFKNIDELSRYLLGQPLNVSSLLIKGSRSMTLEKVLPTLRSTLLENEVTPA